MTAPAKLPGQSTVLMVDDESVARTLMEYHLKKAGHRALVADSAATARRLAVELGLEAIDCVVTDYNMPGESGLELLLWLKQSDPTLAVIMVTATTERDTVTATLRGGASDFLDKPINEAKLKAAVAAATAATAQRRRLAETERSVQEVGRAQHQMFGLGPQAAAHLDVCYHPCHAAGGDFVNYFQIAPGRFLVLTADVSGHDLRSAFVSAYFQGMVRGMLEAGKPITQVLESFNHFLLEEWGHSAQEVDRVALFSVCTCAITVDQARHEVSLSNHGIPQTFHVDSHGQVARSPARIDPPLGWFGDLNPAPTPVSQATNGHLLVWTDGLEDLAQALEVSACSCATRLLRVRLGEQPQLDLTRAKDDVLVARIRVAATPAEAVWLPVLHETYHGGQVPEIDRLQDYWQRSLQLALPELPESRLFDVLLAMRETMINALKHGCAGRADQTALVTLAVDTGQRLLRLLISDSGPGHDYDWTVHVQSEALIDLHRGIALIHRVATRISTTRRGAEVTLDFSF